MNSPVPPVERAGHRAWWALLGAPAAWAIQEWSGWYIANAGCHETYGLEAMPSSGVRAIQIGMNLVIVLLVLIAFVGAVSAWRRLRGPENPTFYAMDRQRFVAAAAILVSGAFLLGTIWSTLSSLLLPVCERVR